MVSGLVTSPELQLRICLLEARPISMASKLLMSINSVPVLCRREARQGRPGSRLGLLGRLQVQVGGLDLLFRGGVAGGRGLGVRVVLALDVLVGRAAVGGAHAGEVDAELLGGPQQVVVLVAHL